MAQKTSNPTKQGPARIFIVDDHPMFRYGLGEMVNRQKDLKVCGEADNVQDALKAISEINPDVIIVDISLKGMDGLELIKRIRSRNHRPFILVLSMYDEEFYASRAIQAGANGYIMKEEASERVIDAIRKVLAGDIYLSERMMARIVRQFAGDPSRSSLSPIDVLTDRELEVLRLFGLGLGTRRIAEELHISEKTVEAHRLHIKEKLGIPDITALIRFAVRWVDHAGFLRETPENGVQE